MITNCCDQRSTDWTLCVCAEVQQAFFATLRNRADWCMRLQKAVHWLVRVCGRRCPRSMRSWSGATLRRYVHWSTKVRMEPMPKFLLVSSRCLPCTLIDKSTNGTYAKVFAGQFTLLALYIDYPKVRMEPMPKTPLVSQHWLPFTLIDQRYEGKLFQSTPWWFHVGCLVYWLSKVRIGPVLNFLLMISRRLPCTLIDKITNLRQKFLCSVYIGCLLSKMRIDSSRYPQATILSRMWMCESIIHELMLDPLQSRSLSEPDTRAHARSSTMQIVFKAQYMSSCSALYKADRLSWIWGWHNMQRLLPTSFHGHWTHALSHSRTHACKRRMCPESKEYVLKRSM